MGDDCTAIWNGLILRAECMDEDRWWWAISKDNNDPLDELDSSNNYDIICIGGEMTRQLAEEAAMKFIKPPSKPDFIKKYFHDTDDNRNKFNAPATSEQIANLEDQFEIELPNDYKEFLKFTNGFEGWVNEFVVRFVPVEQIYQSTQNNCAEFFPWAIYIGTNGNVEMFVIDKRQTPYQFGLLPYIADDNDFIPLGDSFEKFIERLYNDTAYKKQ